jgi:demethylmenaquinone methyltransferase/2-methoxy-6-polyprenyl-1,4-benzoquinol methylase
MSNFNGRKRAIYVRDLFTRIARRYDLLNRLMTAGQDTHWRNEVVRLAALQPGSRLLDIGTGTGDLTRAAYRQCPEASIVAADFTLEMMRIGQKRGNLPFIASDTLKLPFPDATFDSVISGFLMRNVINLQQALQEQYRALKDGGTIVILDTTHPQRNLLSPFIWVHLHVVIPLLGRLLSGTSDAYRYLPNSTEHFLTARQLADEVTAVGFKNVHFKYFMLGTIAIHWASK